MLDGLRTMQLTRIDNRPTLQMITNIRRMMSIRRQLIELAADPATADLVGNINTMRVFLCCFSASLLVDEGDAAMAADVLQDRMWFSILSGNTSQDHRKTIGTDEETDDYSI